ncbi:ground-like domain protein [Ostertagia ostertagi]
MIRRFTVLLLTNVVLLRANDSSEKTVSNNSEALVQGQGQQYSFPPNNTPVTKVYVFGRPIYVRQPFVLPLRDDPYNPSVESPPLRDQGSFPVVPAVPVVGNLEQAILKEELMKPIFTSPMRYRLPERQFEEPAQQPVYVQPKPRYPLPQCYTNDSGFMCCNRELERVMRDVLEELTADKGWQTCNVQKIANTLQNRTQSIFNTDFEALAGLGDFASKTHFTMISYARLSSRADSCCCYATPNRYHPPPGYITPPTETTSVSYI